MNTMINITVDKFIFLTHEFSMEKVVKNASVEFKTKDVKIEFWYNEYDNEFYGNFMHSNLKYNLFFLLNIMEDNQSDETVINCTSKEYFIEKISYYAITLKNHISSLLIGDKILDKAIEKYILYCENIINSEDNYMNDLLVSKLISEKKYNAALDILEKKSFKTIKDIEKIDILKKLIVKI